MNSFSISQMQQFSGVKAHTLRIWEKRYNGLKPDRSEGNTRYYSDKQLRRLLNIVSLMNAGHRISELCKMADTGLSALINTGLKTGSSVENITEYYISQLIAAGMDFDEIHFDKIFSNCLLRYGLTGTYADILYPMLVRIGLLWAKDEVPPSQEHFISNVLRKKIFSAVDSLPPPEPAVDSWILFLPEGEFHEIGLLFAHYLISQAGRKSIYLGQDVPLESLEKAALKINPQNILLFLTSGKDPGYRQAYLNRLYETFSNITIHVSGNDTLLYQLKPNNRINIIHSAAQLDKILGTRKSTSGNIQ